MIYILKKSKFVSFLVLISSTIAAAQDVNMSIPLSKTTIFGDKMLFGDFITLNRSSTLQIDFNNIRNNISFIIIQVHSHLYNITMYSVNDLSTKIFGTNLGLHSNSMDLDKFYVENSEKDKDLKLYVAVHGYSETDPVPGGCNIEFRIKISPFLMAIHNRNYINVDAAPAKCDVECDSNNFLLRFYMLYLPEQNFDSDVYFEGIKNMMSLENILKNGRLIPKTFWNTRRMINAYPGTGAVFVAVAYATKYCANDGSVVPDETKYSVYVPTASYGCWPQDEDCELLEDSLSQFMCASLFFVGIFICFFGHRFFKSQTFLIGFLSGLVVTYIIVALIKKDLDRPATLALAAFSGLCIGAARVVYWWIYGLPVFSIILSSADVGFLMSSVVFYAIPDSMSQSFYLYLDLNFWTFFVLIITIVTIILLTLNHVANMICCAVVGAYAIVLPIDYYLGSQMKYILINIERRATVPEFYKAVTMATFQWKDGILTTLWIGLSISGLMYQHHKNRGRPPFPPPPPRGTRAVPEEPTPVPGTSGYRKSVADVDGIRSLPYYFNERTPLLS